MRVVLKRGGVKNVIPDRGQDFFAFPGLTRNGKSPQKKRGEIKEGNHSEEGGRPEGRGKRVLPLDWRREAVLSS